MCCLLLFHFFRFHFRACFLHVCSVTLGMFENHTFVLFCLFLVTLSVVLFNVNGHSDDENSDSKDDLAEKYQVHNTAYYYPFFWIAENQLI